MLQLCSFERLLRLFSSTYTNTAHSGLEHLHLLPGALTLAVTAAVTALLLVVADRRLLGVPVETILLEETIDTTGIMIAMTANMIAVIEIMTDEIVTTTVVTATVNALVTVLVALMRGIVTLRMTVSVVTRTVSAETTKMKM